MIEKPNFVFDNGNFFIKNNNLTLDDTLSFDKTAGTKMRVSIKTVSCSHDVTTINSRLFFLCGNLEKVTLDKNVLKLGNNVFEGCEKLNKIVIMSDNFDFSDALDAFKGCKNLIIEVPTAELQKRILSNVNFLGNSSLKVNIKR